MLTYEDCVGLSLVSEEEIQAIAMHEHIPEIVAMELGHYLIQLPNGIPAIKRIIVDDIEAAKSKGNAAELKRLRVVLWHFLETHPDNPRNQPN